MRTMQKDPAEVLDYTWDWTPLLGTGETISTSLVTVPGGLTLVSDSHGPTTVTAWISGGTAPTVHRVTCRVVTSAGRTFERSFTLECVER